ncbi:hypothetical protein RAS1_36400 [Phycisphaerae bacterium RAS1]|nr:hypothetical protein RAS1_36400 [Phycisphaerae bacterium RAS1]
MVRDGMAEALESRFRGGRSADELLLLARAYTNKARRVTQADERERAFSKGDETYRKALADLERAAAGQQREKQKVALAAAHVELGNMLLNFRAGGPLDELELTGGLRGDRKAVLALLEPAREQFESAARIIKPLADQLFSKEDEYAAAGILQPIGQVRLDAAFGLAWSNYYVGRTSDPGDRRRTSLENAAKRFRELLDEHTAEKTGPLQLGLALTQRELDRPDDAERLLQSIADTPAEDVAFRAQARYELARCRLAQSKFAAARETLTPLVEKELERLAAEDRPARFYISLAKLWDANSYLLEAAALRKSAEKSAGGKAILLQAQRATETGIARFNRLRALGGSWPPIVQLYIGAGIDPAADPRQLGPSELLATAQLMLEAGKYRDARLRLEEAAGRNGVDKDVAGDIAFELGRCLALLNETRPAAEMLEKLAREQKSHEKAPRAATLAYQLWAKVAKLSEKRADYARLAATLLNLLQSYPDHPEREAAAWWYPVALQHAARYEEAAVNFGNIPPGSKYWEEAQFRRALCGRLLCESAAGVAADARDAAARKAATALVAYSDEAYQRAEKAANRAAVLKLSAEARVNAGEMMTASWVEQYELALQLLEPFEQRYPESELTGRVLGVRIRAYRGLRDLEKASKILDQYVRSVPPERTAGVLATLARGLQEEVERLQREGQTDAAARMAAESITAFEQLESLLAADPGRAGSAASVAFGRAQMLRISRQYDAALRVASELLARDPKSGPYQHLRAQILAEGLGDAPAPAQLREAQEAWEALLADPGLRQRSPERYWEARCQWLTILLRGGRAAEVHKAIHQERLWYPDLGGSPWQERLEELYRRAAAESGMQIDSDPAGGP